MAFYSIVHGAAVHMIDLILWLIGEKPVEVQGYGNQIATSDSDFRFRDFASILLKFENDIVAKVSANGGCVHPHFHRLSIYGTNKTFIQDISGGKLIESNSYNAEIKEVNEDYPAVKEKRKVITTFLDSIVNHIVQPIVTNEDVFSTMSVCFAAEKSIQEGRPIQIEYI